MIGFVNMVRPLVVSPLVVRPLVVRPLARWAALSLFALGVAGCGGGGAAVDAGGPLAATALESLAVTPPTITVQVGATQPLTVATLGPQGQAITGATVSFTSNNAAVAEVDASGVVRGVTAGTTIITVLATRSGVSRTATVTATVTPAPAGGSNIVSTSGTTFVPATITIATGGSVVWQITGATHNVTFGTNKPTGGDVPNTVSGGTATRVFPTAGTYPYECTLHSGMTGSVVVQGTTAPVFTSLTVLPSTPSIAVGGTVQLTAAALDQNGTVMFGLPAAGWLSSNDAVARVSVAGLVTGGGAGTATITATVISGGITKSAISAVTVSPPASGNVTVTTPSDTFSPQTVTIATGGAVTWQFSGSTHNVTFGALKPTGGDIPNTDPGNAASRTFAAAGTYDYQCTRHSGMTGKVVVQASGPPGQFTSLSLTPPTVFVTPGATAQLTATPLDGTGSPMTGLGSASFTSTNIAVATVNASGLVSGIANGIASVIATLTSNGATHADTSAVTVGTASATVTTTATEFSPEEVEIAPGGTVVWEILVATHNITFDDEQPPGGNVPDSPPGTRVARTFTVAGDYDYTCTLHDDMEGRIRVR